MTQSNLVDRLRAESDAWSNGSGDISNLLRESADMIVKLQSLIKAHEDLAICSMSRYKRMQELGYTKRSNITGINSMGMVIHSSDEE